MLVEGIREGAVLRVRPKAMTASCRRPGVKVGARSRSSPGGGTELRAASDLQAHTPAEVYCGGLF
jgi:hypothetical protein